MYQITKDFEFCMGHRVWSQTLNDEFSDNRKCSCRFLHGHQVKVRVSLSALKLEAGMVTDFRHLEFVKKFLDTYIDHHFVIDSNDPLFESLVGVWPMQDVKMPNCEIVAGQKINLDKILNANSAVMEHLESFFVVPFVPTSENLSEWLFGIISEKISKLGVVVTKIEWWESPKSCSEFSV